MDILKILNINKNENIWIIDKYNNFIDDNPYYINNEKLFDNKDTLRDDVLGRLIRKDVIISKREINKLKTNDKYFFLNESLEVKHRRYKNNLVDIFNVSIGNIFIKDTDITKDDIERIKSIISMFICENKNIFPYKINNHHDLFEKIRKLDLDEKNIKESIIDNGVNDNNNYDGILEKIFNNSNGSNN